MSGKFNGDEYTPRTILLGKETVDLFYYIDEDGYLTDIPFVILVNKKIKDIELVKNIANCELVTLGYNNYTLGDIELGNLDYDEYDEAWHCDGGNYILSETMWIVQLKEV